MSQNNKSLDLLRCQFVGYKDGDLGIGRKRCSNVPTLVASYNDMEGLQVDVAVCDNCFKIMKEIAPRMIPVTAIPISQYCLSVVRLPSIARDRKARWLAAAHKANMGLTDWILTQCDEGAL